MTKHVEVQLWLIYPYLVALHAVATCVVVSIVASLLPLASPSQAFSVLMLSVVGVAGTRKSFVEPHLERTMLVLRSSRFGLLMVIVRLVILSILAMPMQNTSATPSNAGNTDTSNHSLLQRFASLTWLLASFVGSGVVAHSPTATLRSEEIAVATLALSLLSVTKIPVDWSDNRLPPLQAPADNVGCVILFMLRHFVMATTHAAAVLLQMSSQTSFSHWKIGIRAMIA
eukprot:2553551-Prymnesium_polylepis.3